MTAKSFTVWRSLLIPVIVCLDIQTAIGEHHWISARLNNVVRIDYPSSWQLISINKEGLDIKSAKGGYEGIGIGPHQAEIIASFGKSDVSSRLTSLLLRACRNKPSLYVRSYQSLGTKDVLAFNKLLVYLRLAPVPLSKTLGISVS